MMEKLWVVIRTDDANTGRRIARTATTRKDAQRLAAQEGGPTVIRKMTRQEVDRHP